MKQQNLILNIHPKYEQELFDFPWDEPLDKWDPEKIQFIDVRKGKSKHVIKFVKTKSFSFAVKQTTHLNAYFESETYKKLISLGINAIFPAGYVVYKKRLFLPDEKISKKEKEKNELCCLVTVLEDRSIPHSILINYDFTEENRKTIYKAIAELLASLHQTNIYWGDASLTNNLIKFTKEKDEWGRTKTVLKAFLADAETVEMMHELPEKYKKKDVDYFINSLTEFKDKNTPGNEFTSLENDKLYFKQEYEYQTELLKSIAAFRKLTGLDVNKHFYKIEDKNSLESISKQIEEHKWYLSEKADKEIDLKKAAKEWIKNVYNPIINEFEKIQISSFFPNTNSVNLYVQIMAHKYYLSLEADEDVGINTAIKSYCENYSKSAEEDTSFSSMVKQLLQRLIKILPANYI